MSRIVRKGLKTQIDQQDEAKTDEPAFNDLGR
jgi:hypothetical protein